MVVKARRGRRRYVAFSVSATARVTLDALTAALKSAAIATGQTPPKIIEFDGTYGIVRGSNLDKLRLLALMVQVAESNPSYLLATLSTSGTLKALRSRTRRGPKERGQT